MWTFEDTTNVVSATHLDEGEVETPNHGSEVRTSFRTLTPQRSNGRLALQFAEQNPDVPIRFPSLEQEFFFHPNRCSTQMSPTARDRLQDTACFPEPPRLDQRPSWYGNVWEWTQEHATLHTGDEGQKDTNREDACTIEPTRSQMNRKRSRSNPERLVGSTTSVRPISRTFLHLSSSSDGTHVHTCDSFPPLCELQRGSLSDECGWWWEEEVSCLRNRKEQEEAEAQVRFFSRQQPAFDACFHVETVCGSALGPYRQRMVFAIEPPELSSEYRKKGRFPITKHNVNRYYAVATPAQMWRYIEATRAMGSNAHVYEVIPDGHPCHAYFDIECTSDEAIRCGITVRSVIQSLLSAWNKGMPRPPYAVNSDSSDQPEFDGEEIWHLTERDLVVLESSPMTTKFSLHVIVRVPNSILWPRNTILGPLFEQCLRPYITLSMNEPLSVHRSDENSISAQSLIDMCVYSRNRCFRCAFCSKRGKEATLVVSSSLRSLAWDAEDAFYRSLVTLIPDGSLELQEHSTCTKSLSPHHKYVRIFSEPWIAEFLRDQRGKHNTQWSNGYQLPSHGTEHEAVWEPVARGLMKRGDIGRRLQNPLTTGFHPALDAYIRETVDEWRSCVLNPTSEVVCYALKNSRYCGNIGRSHRSNGTYVQVSLQTYRMCQRCFDYECRHYRGHEVLLPEDLIQVLESFRIEKQNV